MVVADRGCTNAKALTPNKEPACMKKLISQRCERHQTFNRRLKQFHAV